MSGFIGQVRALQANALLRARPDETYADGDDSTWMTVDWPAITHEEVVLGRRLNVVSPGWVRETLAALGGDGGVPASEVAEVYLDAVEGTMTGRTLTVG